MAFSTKEMPLQTAYSGRHDDLPACLEIATTGKKRRSRNDTDRGVCLSSYFVKAVHSHPDKSRLASALTHRFRVVGAAFPGYAPAGEHLPGGGEHHGGEDTRTERRGQCN